MNQPAVPAKERILFMTNKAVDPSVKSATPVYLKTYPDCGVNPL